MTADMDPRRRSELTAKRDALRAQQPPPALTWERFVIATRDGSPQFTWRGDEPMIHAVALGCGSSATLERMPPECDTRDKCRAYAQQRGGVWVSGWISDDIVRRR